MKKFKLGDIIEYDTEKYGLVIDKTKILGETRTLKLFLFNEKNHGERIKEVDARFVRFVAHSYDFDNLRNSLPKKTSAMIKH